MLLALFVRVVRLNVAGDLAQQYQPSFALHDGSYGSVVFPVETRSVEGRSMHARTDRDQLANQ
jgi:hypothetical protein